MESSLKRVGWERRRRGEWNECKRKRITEEQRDLLENQFRLKKYHDGIMRMEMEMEEIRCCMCKCRGYA